MKIYVSGLVAAKPAVSYLDLWQRVMRQIEDKIKIYELFSGFSEVKMSIKIDVSISFTGLLQVVKKFFNMADRFFFKCSTW